MSNWKLSNLIIALVLFFLFPIVLSKMMFSKWTTQDRANYELMNRYECDVEAGCTVDFDNDGKKEKVVMGDLGNNFVVHDGERVLFSLPYKRISNSLRTHVAINNDYELPRLLIYDKINNDENGTLGVFILDLHEFRDSSITERDKEILDAMESSDETFMWRERVHRKYKLMVGVFGYYIFYVMIVAWIFCERRQQAKLNLP